MLDTQSRSIREQVSAQEWETRVNLAACYRLMSLYGMSDMAFNHITARVPGQEEHFLINPFGLIYDQVKASNLVKVDLDGKIILHPGVGSKTINPAGYVIHSAIHEARPDVKCVAHIHTPVGMAVSAMKCGLLPIAQDFFRFYKRIGYLDYSGLASAMPEQKTGIVAALGKHNALIMKNHGLLACGETIPETFNDIYTLHKCCVAQVHAMAARTELDLPSEAAMELVYKQMGPGRRRFGLLEWDAMLWQVERHDPSYKD